jgi:shikimate kinase
MPAKNIVLIGPPGAGKTSCGQALARQLGWTFSDTDRLIEKKMNQSVAEIFARYGESYFRQLERDMLEELCSRLAAGSMDRYVIGTGGGLPVAPGNFELLSQIGLVVCLAAPVSELARRLAGTGDRPLLSSGQAGSREDKTAALKKRLDQLLAERSQVYKRASYTVETGGFEAEEVAEQIVKLLGLSQCSSSGC